MFSIEPARINNTERYYIPFSDRQDTLRCSLRISVRSCIAILVKIIIDGEMECMMSDLHTMDIEWIRSWNEKILLIRFDIIIILPWI